MSKSAYFPNLGIFNKNPEAQTPASGFTIFSLLQQVCAFVLAETLGVIRQLYNIYNDLCEADHPQAQLQLSGGKIQVQKRNPWTDHTDQNESLKSLTG